MTSDAINTEQAWEDFKEKRSFEKAASVQGQLDTMAAMLQDIQTNTQRTASVIDQINGDNAAIDYENANADPMAGMGMGMGDAMSEEMPPEIPPEDMAGGEDAIADETVDAVPPETGEEGGEGMSAADVTPEEAMVEEEAGPSDEEIDAILSEAPEGDVPMEEGPSGFEPAADDMIGKIKNLIMNTDDPTILAGLSDLLSSALASNQPAPMESFAYSDATDTTTEDVNDGLSEIKKEISDCVDSTLGEDSGSFVKGEDTLVESEGVSTDIPKLSKLVKVTGSNFGPFNAYIKNLQDQGWTKGEYDDWLSPDKLIRDIPREIRDDGSFHIYRADESNGPMLTMDRHYDPSGNWIWPTDWYKRQYPLKKSATDIDGVADVTDAKKAEDVTEVKMDDGDDPMTSSGKSEPFADSDDETIEFDEEIEDAPEAEPEEAIIEEVADKVKGAVEDILDEVLGGEGEEYEGDESDEEVEDIAEETESFEEAEPVGVPVLKSFSELMDARPRFSAVDGSMEIKKATVGEEYEVEEDCEEESIGGADEGFKESCGATALPVENEDASKTEDFTESDPTDRIVMPGDDEMDDGGKEAKYRLTAFGRGDGVPVSKEDGRIMNSADEDLSLEKSADSAGKHIASFSEMYAARENGFAKSAVADTSRPGRASMVNGVTDKPTLDPIKKSTVPSFEQMMQDREQRKYR